MKEGKVKKVKKPAKVLKDKVDFEDAFMRLQAEFINYKRRENEERGEFVRFAAARSIVALLPAIDNLNLTMKHVPEGVEKNWLQGLEATLKSINNGLAEVGVKKMDLEGKKFDADLAEAVGVEAGEKDVVLRVLADGYMVHDKMLRLAKVIVGSGEKVIN